MVCSPGVEDTKGLYIVTRLKDKYCQSNKDTVLNTEERGQWVHAYVVCVVGDGRHLHP